MVSSILAIMCPKQRMNASLFFKFEKKKLQNWFLRQTHILSAGLLRHLRDLRARRRRGGLHGRPPGDHLGRVPERSTVQVSVPSRLGHPDRRLRPCGWPRHLRLQRHPRDGRPAGQAHSHPRVLRRARHLLHHHDRRPVSFLFFFLQSIAITAPIVLTCVHALCAEVSEAKC